MTAMLSMKKEATTMKKGDIGEKRVTNDSNTLDEKRSSSNETKRTTGEKSHPMIATLWMKKATPMKKEIGENKGHQ